MGVIGALQVRLKSPRRSEAMVKSWCLPAFVHPFMSVSISWQAGEDLVVIKKSIADKLAIRDGDEVEFVFVEVGDTVRLKVKVKEDFCADVMIHDLMSLGLLRSMRGQMQMLMS